jgi:hypothetical protein
MEGRSQGAHNEMATRRHPVKKLDGLVSTAARHAGDDVEHEPAVGEP